MSDYHISEDYVLFLSLYLTKSKQSYPCCHTQIFVIRKGTQPKLHQVRHLRYFNRETFLLIPMKGRFFNSIKFPLPINMHKARHTKNYNRGISKPLAGTTVKQLTHKFKIPYSTDKHFSKQHLTHLIPSIQRNVIAAAQESTRLILGIEDFAI